MGNSKALKRLVRKWMAANPGLSYQAALNHLRELKAAQELPHAEKEQGK